MEAQSHKRGARVWLVGQDRYGKAPFFREEFVVVEAEVLAVDPDDGTITVNVRPGCRSKRVETVPKDKVYWTEKAAEARKLELESKTTVKPIDAETGRCSFCDNADAVVAISEASGRKVTICETCTLWAQNQIDTYLKQRGLLK